MEGGSPVPGAGPSLSTGALRPLFWRCLPVTGRARAASLACMETSSSIPAPGPLPVDLDALVTELVSVLRLFGVDVRVEPASSGGTRISVYLPVVTPRLEAAISRGSSVDKASSQPPGALRDSDSPEQAGLTYSEGDLAVVLFSSFRLDLTNETLWQNGVELPLRAKPFAILRYFVEHPNRLVSQQDLIEAIWGQVVTSDSLLRTHVHELRQVLGEGIVETVTGRGYRFMAEVTRTAERIPSPRLRPLRVRE